MRVIEIICALETILSRSKAREYIAGHQRLKKEQEAPQFTQHELNYAGICITLVILNKLYITIRHQHMSAIHISSLSITSNYLPLNSSM
jgi:hypothetical protein